MKLSTIIAVSLLSLPEAFGFFTQTMPRKPLVEKISKEQVGTTLDIRLDVVNKEDDASRMSINGFLLKLTDQPSSKADRPTMPGADGPNSRLSGGVRSLEILREGQFIDMTGLKKAHVKNGCWELLWKSGPTGSLICGFEAPEEIRRNSASLPAGEFFVSFPLFSPEALADLQVRKADVERMAAQFKKEKQEHFVKSQEANNPLMKLWHYREAAAAMERHQLLGIKRFEYVPNSNEVVKLGDSVCMSQRGMIWTRQGPLQKQAVCGYAHAKFPILEAFE